MTPEAERLALRITSSIALYPEYNTATEVAALLRKQAAEIETLSLACHRFSEDEMLLKNERIIAELTLEIESLRSKLEYDDKIVEDQATLIESLRLDAARYRWLKAQPALDLRSDGWSIWTNAGWKFVASHRLCAGNTAYSPHSTLDATIDAAMGEQDAK
jgi:hypothetical protein